MPLRNASLLLIIALPASIAAEPGEPKDRVEVALQRIMDHAERRQQAAEVDQKITNTAIRNVFATQRTDVVAILSLPARPLQVLQRLALSTLALYMAC